MMAFEGANTCMQMEWNYAEQIIVNEPYFYYRFYGLEGMALCECVNQCEQCEWTGYSMVIMERWQFVLFVKQSRVSNAMHIVDYQNY